jgi:hypothetical protein
MELTIPPRSWKAIHAHLDHPSERAAFLYAREARAGSSVWKITDQWLLSSDDDYQSVSGEHLALADGITGAAIKRAHDCGSALIELHGHYGPGERTRFSTYDLRGLAEMARHVLWRLPGRPYCALVIGRESFDALAWTDTHHVDHLDGLRVGRHILHATGLSLSPYSSLIEDAR